MATLSESNSNQGSEAKLSSDRTPESSRIPEGIVGVNVVVTTPEEVLVPTKELPVFNNKRFRNLENGWVLCRLAYLLGIPLAVRVVQDYPLIDPPDKDKQIRQKWQPAIRTIIDPSRNFLSKKWLCKHRYSQDPAVLQFVRLDGEDFGLLQYSILLQYMVSGPIWIHNGCPTIEALEIACDGERFRKFVERWNCPAMRLHLVKPVKELKDFV